MMDVGEAAERGNVALRQIGRAQEFLSCSIRSRRATTSHPGAAPLDG
jgi:hypothetical protein